jgi:Leucine-rich repeat (LRR) protein
MAKFSSWPTAFSKLQHLQNIYIHQIPFTHIPPNAFDGSKAVLTTLVLSHSKLARIPSAVCHLQNLQTLTFTYNSVESSDTLIEPCAHKLTQLKTLDLHSDNLHNFPDVLHEFQSLITLDLDDNKIGFVQSNVIPLANKLQNLYMNLNKLTRIPSAFNHLKDLNVLKLQNNQISTIGDHDLEGLTKLTRLDLYNNPIVNIATHAFKHNLQLSYLQLSGTKLQLVPEAVRFLPRLSTLFFSADNRFDCSCHMSYLKGWDVTAVTNFNGNCVNPKTLTVKQYLITQLHNCP